jgi:hypothetical protein
MHNSPAGGYGSNSEAGSRVTLKRPKTKRKPRLLIEHKHYSHKKACMEIKVVYLASEFESYPSVLHILSILINGIPDIIAIPNSVEDCAIIELLWVYSRSH